MSGQRTITVEQSRESREQFESWEPYADYLYEQTNLSQRQAEVIALKRFGHDRQSCADALGVEPNTVDRHTENASQKRARSRFERDLFGADVRAEFAPVLLRRVTATADEAAAGRAEVRLYANHAGGDALTDTPSYMLVEEEQATGATERVVRTDRRVSYYDSWDELVYAGFVTRVFLTRELETLAEVALAVFSTREELATTRREMAAELESEYERVHEGDTTADEVARVYKLSPDFVQANIETLMRRRARDA